MGDEPALVPTEIREVDFYGDIVTGALVQLDGGSEVYVPLREICDFLGLNWSGQRQRTMRDEVLSGALRGVVITHTPGVGGGTQEMLCLPLKLLPGWLFGVSTDRIKDKTIRAKVILYRRECYDVLWNAFKYIILPQTTAIVPTQPSGAALAYELATAVQNLAREQMELEQRMNRSAQWARGIEQRVTALEIRLSPERQISEAQAAELALQVKAIAYALTQRGQANGYQAVYGELYRRYQIGTYKALPQGKFDEAIAWLQSWHSEISEKKAGDE
jgi:hypothetical protein